MTELGWEKEDKHVFILSSSGKPIYSRYGDEQELVATFGLIQAMISVVIASGDSIQCMTAGKRKIVFFIKESLYFVVMTCYNEPEVVLVKLLQFLYFQILFALTVKVQDVLSNNPSVDLRVLLGMVKMPCELLDEMIMIYCSTSNRTPLD